MSQQDSERLSHVWEESWKPLQLIQIEKPSRETLLRSLLRLPVKFRSEFKASQSGPKIYLRHDYCKTGRSLRAAGTDQSP